jgi:hypothetical protein
MSPHLGLRTVLVVVGGVAGSGVGAASVDFAAFVGVGLRKSVVVAVDAPTGVRGMVTIVGA